MKRDEAETLRTELKRVRRSLAIYGCHQEDCAKDPTMNDAICTCGFDAALQPEGKEP